MDFVNFFKGVDALEGLLYAPVLGVKVGNASLLAGVVFVDHFWRLAWEFVITWWCDAKPKQALKH